MFKLSFWLSVLDSEQPNSLAISFWLNLRFFVLISMTFNFTFVVEMKH